MYDEQPWPGPSWSFTVHTGGFPPMNAPGDLYINLSGLRYINTGKGFISITEEEWDELLAESEPDPLDEEVGSVQVMTVIGAMWVRDGDMIAMPAGTFTVRRDSDGSYWLVNMKTGKRTILNRVRESYMTRLMKKLEESWE